MKIDRSKKTKLRKYLFTDWSHPNAPTDCLFPGSADQTREHALRVMKCARKSPELLVGVEGYWSESEIEETCEYEE